MAEAEAHGHGGETRRDFIYLLGGAMGAVGAAAFAWPLIDSLSPAADTKAASTTEVDLAAVKEGQAVTVKWRGSPVFIRYRTKVGSSRVDLQACKLEYSIVSPK